MSLSVNPKATFAPNAIELPDEELDTGWLLILPSDVPAEPNLQSSSFSPVMVEPVRRVTQLPTVQSILPNDLVTFPHLERATIARSSSMPTEDLDSYTVDSMAFFRPEMSCASRKHIQLGRVGVLPPGLLRRVGKIPNVVSLFIDCSDDHDHSWDFLESMNDLTHLDLSKDQSFKGELPAIVGKAKNLQVLILPHSQMKDSDFIASVDILLKEKGALQKLTIKGGERLTDAILPSLEKLCVAGLRSLKLRRVEVTSEITKKALDPKSPLSKIEQLVLSRCFRVEPIPRTECPPNVQTIACGYRTVPDRDDHTDWKYRDQYMDEVKKHYSLNDKKGYYDSEIATGYKRKLFQDKCKRKID